jgi:uroporphyrinogen decarboxylase
MTKRDLIEKTFANEKTERVPVGFWFHFVDDEARDGFTHPEMFKASLEGQKRYFDEFQPDFVKIMSDGFFHYPDEHFTNAQTVADLAKVAPLDACHPWIEKQVEHVTTLTRHFGPDVCGFYNIFAPATLFRFGHYNHNKAQNADTLLADLVLQDRAVVERAFAVVERANICVARRVVEEGGAGGIYYSTQDPADPRIDEAARQSLFVAPDLAILGAAPGARNILHICGYAGYKNDLSHFAGYPAAAVNWASVVENVSLAEGKERFGGRCVIGGFGNTVNDILYSGDKERIEAETRRLVRDAGTRGVIIGADCTVPRTIDMKRLQWVRDFL